MATEPEKPKLGPPVDIIEIALFGPGRYRYWLIPCAIIGLVIGLGVALIQPATYMSQAKMYVKMGARETIDAERLIRGQSGGNAGRSRRGTPTGGGLALELQLMRTNEFYEKVAREVGPARLAERLDPLQHLTPRTPRFERWQLLLQDWWYNRGKRPTPEQTPRSMNLDTQVGVSQARAILTQGLRMGGAGTPNQMAISYVARSPELAQDVVQAVVKVAMQRHFEIYDERFNADFVRAKRDEAEHDLKLASEEYYKHQQDCGFYDINKQRTQLLDQRAHLVGKLETGDLRLEEIQRELEYTEEQLAVTPEESIIEVEPRLDTNPIYAQTFAQLEQLSRQVATLDMTYKPESPAYADAKAALDAQIEATQRTLENNPPMIMQGFDYEYEGPNPDFYKLERDVERLEQERETVLIGQTKYRNRLATIAQSMDALVACEPRHDEMRKIISDSRGDATQFRRALQKREEAKIMDVDESMGNIWVMQQPSYPRARGTEPRTETVLMGLGIGIGVGVALAILRQLLDQRLRYPFAVQRILGAPVLGVIPEERTWTRITKRLRKKKSLPQPAAT